MACVGDELLLLLRAANHWVDGPAREQHNEQKNKQDACRIGEQRPHEHHAHRAQLVVAVEEDGDVLAVVRLRDEKAVAAAVAVTSAVRERGGEIFLRVLRRDGGDVVKIFLRQRAIGGVAQDEKTRGKRCFRGKRSLAPRDLVIGRGLHILRIRRSDVAQAAVIFRRRGCIGAVRAARRQETGVGDGARVLVDERQRLLQVGIGRNIVCNVQNDRQQQHHRRDGEHRDTDEAVSQALDHTLSSNT